MRGIHAAATRAAEWLAAEVPTALDRIRISEALDPADLPSPEHVWGHDINQLGIDDWPAVLVVPGQQRGMQYLDALDDGGELYAVTYSLIIYGWVRAEDYEATARIRDRYGLAIREALLTRKQMSAARAWDDPTPRTADAWVKPETIREDYGPPTSDGRRTIAGVEVRLDITVIEQLSGPTVLGDAAAPVTKTVTPEPTSTGGDTRTLPPHPALA
ncbi:hypothetical protein [uncultured Arsenicicoccus sp.]|uniref:hypothetical protein n=1 Tax=uncultured Arsenicicoccus sp. TaxID=491339 RepID=UPI00259819D2|nr:hypothetical protein [uncultured Arsenicicoccus sp.]